MTLHIDVRPVLLGAGLRFFENLDTVQIEVERTRVIESSDFTQLEFRVIK